MPLIETLAIRVGASIAQSLLKVWLKDSNVAVDASATIIDVVQSHITDRATQPRAQRLLEEIGTDVGQRLLTVFQREGANLDEATCNAIAYAVGKTLNVISSQLLAELNYDSSRLTSYLLAHPVAAEHFSETEQSLYIRIISESCRDIVTIASQLPAFLEHTFAEVLEREDQIRQDIKPILRSLDEIAEEKRAEAARKQAERAILIKLALSDLDRSEIHRRLSHFVGRVQECTELQQQIHQMLPTGGYLFVTAQAGQGKSFVIAKLVQEMSPSSIGTAYHFISVKAGVNYQVIMLRDLMMQLILNHNLPGEYELYVRNTDLRIVSDYFPKMLKVLAERGEQAVIFLDGLDQLQEESNGGYDLSFLPPEPGDGIVLVLATRPTHILNDLKTQIQQYVEYSLPDLSRDDFNLLLKDRGVNLTRELADQFYETMQRNALFLEQAAQVIQKEAATPEEIIKRVADDPSKIFSLTIERLKKLTGRGWQEVLKPILGMLLVARDSLTEGQIGDILRLDYEQVMVEGLSRLGGLVVGTGQYVLFHPKFYEYLRRHLFVEEEKTWHRKLADWCEGGRERDGIAAIWQESRYDPVEQGRREYARRHYIAHLYEAREWLGYFDHGWDLEEAEQWKQQRLFAVLDEGAYGRAKIHPSYDPSMRMYALDLDLGRQAASWEGWTLEKGIALLPHLWRYTLLRCSLTNRADKYPLAAFRLLVLLKREQEAIRLAELLTGPANKVKALLEITKQLWEQSNQEKEGLALLLRAGEIARTIESSKDRAEALADLASTLAQAQLWDQAQAVIGMIEYSYERAEALRDLARAMADAGKDAALLQVIHRSWQLAYKRENALGLFPMVIGFIPRNPELGFALHEALRHLPGSIASS
jgi:hypothetical protein